MKKILVIVGSGIENGNTDKLADAYIKGAESAGNLEGAYLLRSTR